MFTPEKQTHVLNYNIISNNVKYYYYQILIVLKQLSERNKNEPISIGKPRNKTTNTTKPVVDSVKTNDLCISKADINKIDDRFTYKYKIISTKQNLKNDLMFIDEMRQVTPIGYEDRGNPFALLSMDDDEKIEIVINNKEIKKVFDEDEFIEYLLKPEKT